LTASASLAPFAAVSVSWLFAVVLRNEIVAAGRERNIFFASALVRGFVEYFDVVQSSRRAHHITKASSRHVILDHEDANLIDGLHLNVSPLAVTSRPEDFCNVTIVGG
jgi:hypothetical protein